MREIVLDTETTGLDPNQGHRLVEIGCVELWDYVPTGKTYHTYLNPERDMPEEAFRIHNLSSSFLKEKPLFKDVYEDFLSFLGESALVIHNAAFDLKFLNSELHRLSVPLIEEARAIDTVKMARQKFPGSPASLDALCSRFKIDNTHRTAHGALVDATLLAHVYLELQGGAQRHLEITPESHTNVFISYKPSFKEALAPRVFPLLPEEEARHEEMWSALKGSLWKNLTEKKANKA